MSNNEITNNTPRLPIPAVYNLCIHCSRNSLLLSVPTVAPILQLWLLQCGNRPEPACIRQQAACMVPNVTEPTVAYFLCTRPYLESFSQPSLTPDIRTIRYPVVNDDIPDKQNTMSDTAPITILGKGIGYGILVGLGAVFAIGMILITKLMTKYLHENHNSTETFMVANRSIGKWWMASCTYSSWTWATEFLFVTTAVQSYGIQASYYYSAGLCIQMCLMNIIGTNSKKKIPTAHTSLEIVEIRYGKVAHFVFMFFALVTSLISCSDMILGAAGAINVIGDVHIVASSLLIPFGVLVYTSFSGLRGTIITDFIHSFILLIVLCYLNTSILTSDKIGGLSNLYDLVFQHQNGHLHRR